MEYHGGDDYEFRRSRSRRQPQDDATTTTSGRAPSREIHVRIEPVSRSTADPAGDVEPAEKRHRSSRARRRSRKKSRSYPEHTQRTDAHDDEESRAQDSDDVLNDYYGRTETVGFGIYGDNYLDIDTGRRRPTQRHESRKYSRYSTAGAVPISMDPGRPSRYDDDLTEGSPPPLRYSSRPQRYSSHLPGYSTDEDGPPIEAIRKPPPGDKLWPRAAKPSKDPLKLRLRLKLLLKRKGNRFRSRPFDYEPGKWDDTELALQIVHQYRTLKTSQIGLMQKLTSYKMISFIYFLQYRYVMDYELGEERWLLEKIPVTDNDSDEARSAFMYQLQEHVRQESRLVRAFSKKKFEPAKKVSRDWVRRLNNLIDLGVVIDIEIKETFDGMKIYFGLLLAILLSLGVALLYGFLVDRDFSTGFSIASWLLTAFGFFAAVVAAGEYLGLEKPTATLTAGEELRAGPIDRGLLDAERIMRSRSQYRP